MRSRQSVKYIKNGLAASRPDFFMAWMRRLQARWQVNQVLDQPIIAWIMGASLLLASNLPISSSLRLRLLIAASRRVGPGMLFKLAQRAMRPWMSGARVDAWRRHRIGWGRYFGDFADIASHRALTTSLLLKAPGEKGEKGVLYSSFEFNWMKLLANHDPEAILDEYFLVGASSWSPSDNAVLANLCGLSKDPIFIGISNQSDLCQYRLFAPDIQAIPILASDWVDPGAFKPLAHDERTIDILMVSHFASWKRHWLLFEALSSMPAHLRVVLIGRETDGVTEHRLRTMAHAYGVRQSLVILKNLEISEVAAHQCNARVCVALSKREGSCVSVAEALFADAPVAMMSDAHVGSKKYINHRTGRVFKRGDLASGLMTMLERSQSFSARHWAQENIAAAITSEKQNAILKQYSLSKGLPWTRDLAPMCWRYVPRYLVEADRLRLTPALQALREKHGVELQEFVSENEGRRSPGPAPHTTSR